MSRGLISSDELTAKIADCARLRRRAMHSIIRDARGKFVPVVRPKRWKASSVERSRERSDRIATARKERKRGWQRRSG